MKEGQSLMFLGAATIDSPFDRLHLSFMRTVYSTALIFMNKGRNYAYNISMAFSVLVLYDNRISLIALSTSFFSGTGGL